MTALHVQLQPFELSVSHCAQWPHGLRVAVPDAVAPPLTPLHAALGEVLQGLDLPVDQRPLRPHLTLARITMAPLPATKGPPPVLARQRLRTGGITGMPDRDQALVLKRNRSQGRRHDQAQDTAMVLALPLISLGKRTVRTPFWQRATALSMLTLRGRAMARWKAP